MSEHKNHKPHARRHHSVADQCDCVSPGLPGLYLGMSLADLLQYRPNQPMTFAPTAALPAAMGTGTPSGVHWVAQFPGSTDIDDLAPDFKRSVKSFIKALQDAKADFQVNATYRPPQRAYLMHWAWMIVNKNFDAQRVPPMAGVAINWWHGSKEKSVEAARSMVVGYGIAKLKVAPALKSRHTTKQAIDMAVSWKGTLTIAVPNLAPQDIKSLPKNHTNIQLIGIGALYGVKHFATVDKDKVHWSTDGH